MYGSRHKGASEQTTCMCSSKERGRGEWPKDIVTTDHTNGCLEAAIRSEGCVYVLGWERFFNKHNLLLLLTDCD